MFRCYLFEKSKPPILIEWNHISGKRITEYGDSGDFLLLLSGIWVVKQDHSWFRVDSLIEIPEEYKAMALLL